MTALIHCEFFLGFQLVLFFNQMAFFHFSFLYLSWSRSLFYPLHWPIWRQLLSSVPQVTTLGPPQAPRCVNSSACVAEFKQKHTFGAVTIYRRCKYGVQRLNVQLVGTAARRRERGRNWGCGANFISSSIQRVHENKYLLPNMTLKSRRVYPEVLWKCFPKQSADQTATAKIARVTAHWFTVSMREVSQAHCLEELLNTCSKACSVILINRPSPSVLPFWPTDIGVYGSVIYKHVEKKHTAPGGALRNHISDMQLLHIKNLIESLPLSSVTLTPDILMVLLQKLDRPCSYVWFHFLNVR